MIIPTSRICTTGSVNINLQTLFQFSWYSNSTLIIKKKETIYSEIKTKKLLVIKNNNKKYLWLEERKLSRSRGREMPWKEQENKRNAKKPVYQKQSLVVVGGMKSQELMIENQNPFQWFYYYNHNNNERKKGNGNQPWI